MFAISSAVQKRNKTKKSLIPATTDPRLRRVVLAKWPATRTAAKVLAKLSKVGVADVDSLRGALTPPNSECAVNVSLRAVGERPFGQQTVESLIQLLDADLVDDE